MHDGFIVVVTASCEGIDLMRARAIARSNGGRDATLR
jgi:hypothetical protein